MKIGRVFSGPLVPGLVLFVALAAGVIYYYSEYPDEDAFSSIAVGDTPQDVIRKMGRPNHVGRSDKLIESVSYEFEYYAWPVPTIWQVGFVHDHVAEKEVLYSP